MKKKEMVNHPAHYANGKIEAIDAMESAFGEEDITKFCVISAFKYLWRSYEKGSQVEDLQKAAWYINKALALLAKKSKMAKPGVIARLSKRLSGVMQQESGKKPARKATEKKAVRKTRTARKPKEEGATGVAKAKRVPRKPRELPAQPPAPAEKTLKLSILPPQARRQRKAEEVK